MSTRKAPMVNIKIDYQKSKTQSCFRNFSICCTIIVVQFVLQAEQLYIGTIVQAFLAVEKLSVNNLLITSTLKNIQNSMPLGVIITK